MFKKLKSIAYIILALSVISMPINASCIIEGEEYIDEVLQPTDKYNIIIKNDTSNDVESYRYEMLDGSGCYDFKLNEGQVTSYLKDDSYTNLGSIIFHNSEKQNYYINEYENRFSYVTLFTNIQGLAQIMTGANWDSNCVPTSVIAAYLWSTDQSIDGYKERIKQLIKEVPYTGLSGLGYRAETVHTLLDHLGINYESSRNYSEITKYLNQGNVLLCAIDSSLLPYASQEDSLIGRSYRGGGGHEVLVTGYLNTYDESTDSYQLYIQYLDPAENFDANRRFVSYDEFQRAIRYISSEYLIVQKDQGPKGIDFGDSIIDDLDKFM